MRIRSLLSFTLLTAALACSDDRPATAPGTANLNTVSIGTIEEQIDALFPGGSRTAARSRLDALRHQLTVEPADPTAERKMMLNLVDYTHKKGDDGFLLDPNGDDPPSTKSAISILTASLFQLVYPDAPPPPVFEEGVDVGVAVVEPQQTEVVVTEESQAGAEFPAGTFSEPVLVTIVEQADPPPDGSGPLPTSEFKQYPKFYDFSVFPNEPTQKDVRIGICHEDDEESAYFPPGDHSTLRVAKETHDEPPQLKILARVDVADFLTCIDVDVNAPIIIGAAPSGVRGLALQLLASAGRAARSLITPKNAYAIDQGIGGILEASVEESEPAFSVFGIIDSVPDTGPKAAVVAGEGLYIYDAETLDSVGYYQLPAINPCCSPSLYTSVVTDGGGIFYVGSIDGRVFSVDGSTGTTALVATFPVGLFDLTLRDGLLYVSGSDMTEVGVVTTDGVAQPGIASPDGSNLRSTAFGPDGSFYLTSFSGGPVQRWSPGFVHAGTFGSENDLSSAFGVDVLSDGSVVVNNQDAQTYYTFSSTGTFIRTTAVNCTSMIWNLAVDENDNVWVACQQHDAVVKFDSNGTEIGRINVDSPGGIAIYHPNSELEQTP